jgi:hypothetical protein
MTPTNAQARQVGMAIRQHRREVGEINAAETTLKARDPNSGETFSLAVSIGDRLRMFSRVYDADIGGRKRWLASNGDVVPVCRWPAWHHPSHRADHLADAGCPNGTHMTDSAKELPSLSIVLSEHARALRKAAETDTETARERGVVLREMSRILRIWLANDANTPSLLASAWMLPTRRAYPAWHQPQQTHSPRLGGGEPPGRGAARPA